MRTGKDAWLRLTKFYGKLLLINFALGVATGIVQEFQFGMNWSEYSRYVGDIFGAPLAMEALAAFFLESTFLGLWIFGWDRLSKKVHLATVWLFAIGTNLSAYFIIAANSWMQHPVGAEYNTETGRAEMNDIGAVLTNPTLLTAFPHVISTAFLVAGTVVAGIAGALAREEEPGVRRKREGEGGPRRGSLDVPHRTSPRRPRHVDLRPRRDRHGRPAGEDDVPAAADEDGGCRGHCARPRRAPSSPCSPSATSRTPAQASTTSSPIPDLTSYLATGDWNSTVTGVEDLQATYVEKMTERATTLRISP